MRERFTVLLTAVVVCASCVSTLDDPVGVPMLGTAPVTDRPECPHDGLLSQREKRGVIIPPSSPQAIITSIPEYHDCQRFVVDHGGIAAFDSVYSIYAAPPPDSKSNDAPRNPDGKGNGGAVALIVSEGGTYNPLGIKPGVNCLYLAQPGGTWKARLVYNGMNGVCPSNPTGGFTNYDVVADPLPAGLTADDVPRVARWDWDAQNRVQYIGIRCGDRWCEIGPPGFKPSPTLAVPAGVFGTDRRVYLIKGWYDRQVLAEPGSDPAVPSRSIGVIVPHFKLTELAESALLQPVGPQLMPSYVEAVRVYLDDNIQLVKTVWVTNAAGAGGTYGWGAVIVQKDGTKKEGSVVYRTHMGMNFTIPATSRWRWNPASNTHPAPEHEHGSAAAAADLPNEMTPSDDQHGISAYTSGSPTSAARAWRALAGFVSEGVWFGCTMGCCEEEELFVLAANDALPAWLFWGGNSAVAWGTPRFPGARFGTLLMQPAFTGNAIEP